jgi:hypothetical protein
MANRAAQYQVVVNGGVLDGHDTGAVVDAFASLMKLEPGAARGYFAGTPRIIKQRTDHATARRIQDAFRRIGVDSSIVPLGGAPAAAKAPNLRLVTRADTAVTAGPAADTEAGEPVEEVFAEPMEEPRRLSRKILAAVVIGLFGLAWAGFSGLFD